MSFYHWFPSHPNECELSGDATKLHEIGQELRVTNAKKDKRPPQTDFQRISSVPDVWSQHRLFEMLLVNRTLDPCYMEYEEIATREWRAILAIVVLAESYGVRLQTETISFLDKQTKSPYLKAAFDMRPNKNQWISMDIYYVEKNGQRYPIAMTSPTVHLVPTRDAWENLRLACAGRIPWLRNDMVNAPIVLQEGTYVPFTLGETDKDRSFAMLPIHALMLKQWLSIYRTNTSKTQNLDILAAYEADLSAAYRLNAQNIPAIGSFFVSEDQAGGTMLYGTPVPKKLQIFLDRVFSARLIPRFEQEDIPDTHRFAGGVSPQNICAIRKENGEISHFFIPMPVTEKFWKLWEENKELNPTYSISADATAEEALTKITISLTLGGLQFSETYTGKRIVMGDWHSLCTAGIWPRQKIANWSEYFLFCYDANDYHIEPLKTGSAYQERIYERQDGVAGCIRYYKFDSPPECCLLMNKRDPIGYFLINDRQVIAKGDFTSVYHASIDFGTSATTLYGSVGSTEPDRINGMNLWSLPLINPVNDIGAEYSRLERFFLPPLPRPIERSAQARKSNARLSTRFEDLFANPELSARYPSCVPMQTILADVSDTNAARDYLRDCWIYFRSFADKRDFDDWPNIYANLKWEHAEPADHHRIRAILAQILVMVALEARSRRCGKIAITATYPLSFEESTRSSYFTALNSMLKSIASVTGLAICAPSAEADSDQKKLTQDAMLVDNITESEAVFRFAVSQKKTADNYFVLDIGGGSTDVFISLLDEKKYRHSYATSFGFGARKVLLEKLRYNKKTILSLLMDRADDGIEKIIHNKRDYLARIPSTNSSNTDAETTGNSIIEDLFSIRVPLNPDHPAAMLVPENFGDAFMEYCANTKGDLLFIELKKRIAFYLGASIWLSGMMLREEKNPNLSVSLLFTGNGSKMVRWLHPDLNRTRYFVYQIFQATVGVGIDQNTIDCMFSAMPKEEVAYGALLNMPVGFYDAAKTMAEQIYFDREDDQTVAIKSYHSLKYGRKDIKTDRAEFEHYLKAFRDCAAASYDWTFSEEEYQAVVLDKYRLHNAIVNKMRSGGYFLNGVDVIGDYYMGDTAEKKTL